MVVEVMGGEVLVGSSKRGGGGRRLYQYSERRESVRCTELPSALSPTRSRELSSIQTSRLVGSTHYPARGSWLATVFLLCVKALTAQLV